MVWASGGWYRLGRASEVMVVGWSRRWTAGRTGLALADASSEDVHAKGVEHVCPTPNSSTVVDE